MAKVMPLLSFGTLITVAVVPLAAGALHGDDDDLDGVRAGAAAAGPAPRRPGRGHHGGRRGEAGSVRAAGGRTG